MYKVAVLPGDGTGPEVVKQGIKVLKAACAKEKIKMEFLLNPAEVPHKRFSINILQCDLKIFLTGI